jgi:hypothetical protein
MLIKIVHLVYIVNKNNNDYSPVDVAKAAYLNVLQANSNGSHLDELYSERAISLSSSPAFGINAMHALAMIYFSLVAVG